VECYSGTCGTRWTQRAASSQSLALSGQRISKGDCLSEIHMKWLTCGLVCFIHKRDLWRFTHAERAPGGVSFDCETSLERDDLIMFKLYPLPVLRLLLAGVVMGVLLAACDNPPASTPVVGNTTGGTTGQASTPGGPTERPPTMTPDLATASGRVDSGNTHFEKNEFDAAIADYTQAIQMQPDLAPAYSDRAATYVEVKEYDKAIADANQAIKLKPDLPWPYAARAAAYRSKGDLDRALADYEQVIKLQPDYAKAYFRRAEILEQLGNKTAAVADYEKAYDYSKDNILRATIKQRLDALEGK